MAYVYLVILFVFLVGLILVAMTADKEDMDRELQLLDLTRREFVYVLGSDALASASVWTQLKHHF